MDPQLSPFVEKAIKSGPVSKFEVREKKRGGRESTVRRLDAAGKSPEDLSEEIWEAIEEDYAGHLGEHYYAVCYYRPEATDFEEKKSFWLKGNLSSAEKDPELRHLEYQELALTNRETHIRDMQQHVLETTRYVVSAQNAVIMKQERQLEAKEARELQTIELFAELTDKKAVRALEMRKEDRKDALMGKLESYGMQLFAEITKGQDGQVQPMIQNEIIQNFVDSLQDAQFDKIMGSLGEEQRNALGTVLKPFILKTLEKRGIHPPQSPPQQVGPTTVVGQETNGVANSGAAVNTSTPPSGAPS